MWIVTLSGPTKKIVKLADNGIQTAEQAGRAALLTLQPDIADDYEVERVVGPRETV